jgi:hypothetical protein
MHPYSNHGPANNPCVERFHHEQEYGGRFGLPVQHSTTELTSGLMDLYGQMLIIAPNRVNPALLWGMRKGCEETTRAPA